MIFSGVSPDGRKHFGMVLDGSKTRTTRLSGRYTVGKDYAIQPKRTKRGIEGYRIVIDKKTLEKRVYVVPSIPSEEKNNIWIGKIPISPSNAKKEGGYTVEEFERIFKNLFPKWNGLWRWAYEFHLMWISMGEREDRIIVCER